jgi:transposase
MRLRQDGAPQSQRLEVDRAELDAILARAGQGRLTAADVGTLKAAIDTLAFLTQELEAKGASIQRLRKMLFGAGTEKTRLIFPSAEGAAEKPPAAPPGAAPGPRDGRAGADGGEADSPAGEKPKPKGHGRNGAATYTGAEKVRVPHGTLKAGDPCPDACGGKVYPMAEPAVLVRVKGMAPLRATIYELERLRCNLCGEVFTAAPPPAVGTAKYDESTAAMIGLLKYGCGLPFNRLERLERALGIPLPASTQWEIVAAAAQRLAPAYAELIRQAAQGAVLHNDDTTAKILALMGHARHDARDQEGDPRERTGIFTTGIVSTAAGRRIALFFTGRKHAGENLADVLAQRAADLAAPIQMCDALSRNTTGDFETLVAHCVTHARRNFVEVADDFPDECRYVLETLRHVYRHDALARTQNLSPADRLALHQTRSGPRMDQLKGWAEAQFAEHRVEPNSTLGDAIRYLLKHWDRLTLFLREPGASLDNTIVERSLKKAILHRKNALFFKTENGAHVGDLYMSLIHTAELLGANPFDYLVALQQHAAQVTAAPDQWMPWNYLEALPATQPEQA